MLENRLHRRHPLVQFIFDNWIYLLIVLCMWQFPAWLSDHFGQPLSDLSPRDLRGNSALNWLAVGIELYILAILAMSYNLLFGFSGIISFGHALFFGTAVYLVIILVQDYGVGLMNTVTAALLVAVLLGLITAVAAFRVKGVYFAMFTLALAEIFFELSRVNLFRVLTNGDDGLRFSGDFTPTIAMNINRLDLYYLTGALAVLTFLFIRRLMNSPTGKVLVAIRENEERASTMGYNTARYKLLVIVISSVLAALSGVLYALFAKGANPETALGLQRTVDPLLMTIIGGTATNPGPIIGAAVLHLGKTFLRKPELNLDLDFILFQVEGSFNTTHAWNLMLGLVFIIVVLVIPYGIVGQLNLLWLSIRRWLRRFVYDPLVRRNPALAEAMQPITGEPPAVALALAQASHGASLAAWAQQSPVAAVYSVIVGLVLLAWLLTGDAGRALSLFLFLALITALPLLAAWLYRRQELWRRWFGGGVRQS